MNGLKAISDVHIRNRNIFPRAVLTLRKFFSYNMTEEAVMTCILSGSKSGKIHKRIPIGVLLCILLFLAFADRNFSGNKNVLPHQCIEASTGSTMQSVDCSLLHWLPPQ